ncbi:beta/gamma crystallin domain-containing protein [Arsenophonus sp.]|uniref:beta/gamma crystallin domain-containing protein n=1 Tax=Arsenophonus sp. TaxID=1872640 RepID=UPI002857191F|nr:beta/gamma crystallin domain-containing protein [Arsenophonus sp.]MDR5616657.1 beta/gamma crystallin domain-containing protein [Arsenophonus sp.]
MNNNQSFSTGVIFYKGKNYTGDSFLYVESNEEYRLSAELNDKFNSVRVGRLSQVQGWKDYAANNAPGNITKIWQYDTPDLSEIKGLSRFTVSPKYTDILAILLNNNTGNNIFYQLVFNISFVSNPIHIKANTDYQCIGSFPQDGNLYNANIAITSNQNRPAIRAQVSFKYNMSTNEIEIMMSNQNFPSMLSFEKVERNRFCLNINHA